eukprot:jgi/Galph1/504/GphlegSOOS_G5238.1
METLVKAAKTLLVNGFSKHGYDDICRMLSQAVEGVTAEELKILETDTRLGLRCIQFVNVAECSSFTISVFIIPTGLRLPLHDHVGMTVITKVLWGELEVDCYDFNERDKFLSHHMGGYGVQYPSFILKPEEYQLFYPFRANLHEFRARRRCAILDVLWPPYNPAEDRDCHYFEAQVDRRTRTQETKHKERPVFLKRIPCPSDFYTESEPYRGPQFELCSF